MQDFFPRVFGKLGSRGEELLLLAAAGSALILLAAASCGRHEAKQTASGPVEVTTVTVHPKDLPVTFEYVAQTQSSHQVNIQARVNGFLDRQVYSEGSMVRSGQVLFLMDKKPFQARVNAAKAALARQKAALETARANLNRVKPLAALNALSPKDLDEATGSFESSAAAVEQAKSQLETAELDLSYCTITSPVTGITGAAQQQDGTYINQQNSQLTTVAVLSPIRVNFSLSENEIQRYHDRVGRGTLIPPPNGGYAVEIIMVDGSVFPHKGRITFAAPSYNAQTGTFLIRASVLNPDGILRPNQFVHARLRGAVRRGAVMVPQRAVQLGGKGHFVWLVDKDGKAEHRPVTVGEWQGDDWLINEGLGAGDRVVVDGGMSLQPGVPVRVKR